MKEGKIKGGVNHKSNLKPIKPPPAPMLSREEYDDLVRDAEEKCRENSNKIQICPVCNHKSFIKEPECRIIKTFFFSGDVHIANKFQWVCHSPHCRYRKERETELTEMGRIMELPFWKRLFTKLEV